MAKKKKPTPQRPVPQPVASQESAAPADPTQKSGLIEVLKHPTLLLAWISVGLSLFAAGAAFHFRDKMEMGAIREPTGAILCAAIAVTLFASYWRERARENKTDS